MTLKDLYTLIEGDYDRVIAVLRVEKLIDKHIRRLPGNAIFTALDEAGKTLEPTAMFEAAHAIKGVCANLGLVKLSDVASELSEEFRPGNARTMSDEDVRKKIAEVDALLKKANDGIRRYESESL